MSRVLIVHSDAVQRHFLATLVQHEGFEVIHSVDAEDACRLLQAQDSIDVMLMDLHLSGVSGWECCRLLHHVSDARVASIPFLCLSSSLSTIEGERVTAFLGGHAFIPLPIAPASLTQSLTHVLEGKKLLAPFQVLLVGDDAEWSRSQSIRFRKNGWAVRECHHVSNIQPQLEGDTPKLIVIHHPVSGHTSLEWMADLKGQVPSARIFVITADHNPQVALEALQYGAHEFIREPFAPEYLDALLAKAERERVGHLFSEEGEHVSSAPKQADGEFKTFLHDLDEIVILTDGDGVIVDMNAQGCRHLGWTAQELRGHTLLTLDPSISLDWCSATPGGSQPRKSRFRMRGGSTMDVVVTAYPVRWSEGVRFILVAKNIQELALLRTELQKLQEQVRQFKELESIGRLAGGIAHDVNNILTAIQGHASLLTYKGSTSAATQRPAEVIRQAAHRGQELTAQLLGATRRGNERRASINVHDSIEEVLDLLAGDRTKEIQIVRALDARDSWIRVNARQLHQILLNLIVNACDAMPDGGTMKISTVSHQKKELVHHQSSSIQDLPFLEIIVADSGCGIPQDLCSTVFEPFFTTKPPSQGSGMGLAIVKEIVESYGGSITLSSKVNQGTSFHLCFPQHEATQSSLIHLPTLLRKPHPKVLVVDDERLVAETTVEMLRLFECDPCVACSGEEAIDLYRDHADEIGLVLLDLSMPSMSGEGCFRALQAINPSIKVVFSSGCEKSFSVQQLFDEGLAGFVQKPFDVEDLSLALQHICSTDRERAGYALSGFSSGAREGV